MLESILKENLYFKNSGKPYWFLKKQNANYTHIVLGTSRADNCVNTDLLNALNPSNSYLNAGVPQASLADCYNFLRVFSLNNVQYDTIILTIDAGQLLIAELNDQKSHLHYFIPYLSDKLVLQSCSNSTSLLQSHLFKYYQSLGFLSSRYLYHLHETRTEQRTSSGYSPLHVHEFSPVLQTANVVQNTRIEKHEINRKYLSAIIDLIHKQNGTVILLTLPYASTFNQAFKELPEFREASSFISKIANLEGVRHVDFNLILQVEDKYFADPLHLNSRGSDVTTKALSSFLNNINS